MPYFMRNFIFTPLIVLLTACGLKFVDPIDPNILINTHLSSPPYYSDPKPTSGTVSAYQIYLDPLDDLEESFIQESNEFILAALPEINQYSLSNFSGKIIPRYQFKRHSFFNKRVLELRDGQPPDNEFNVYDLPKIHYGNTMWVPGYGWVSDETNQDKGMLTITHGSSKWEETFQAESNISTDYLLEIRIGYIEVFPGPPKKSHATDITPASKKTAWASLRSSLKNIQPRLHMGTHLHTKVPLIAPPPLSNNRV